jgi:hypothetical protein
VHFVYVFQLIAYMYSHIYQVEGTEAAHKFMSAIPVKKYCDTVAYKTSLVNQESNKTVTNTTSSNHEEQQQTVEKDPSHSSEVVRPSSHHPQSGIYDGPLSPAARLRAAASQGSAVDDVAVGMGDEEEVCSICLGEFEAHDKVKELK